MKSIYQLDNCEILFSPELFHKRQAKLITEKPFNECLSSKQFHIDRGISPVGSNINFNPFKYIPSKHRNDISCSLIRSKDRRQIYNKVSNEQETAKESDFLPVELLAPTLKDYSTNKSLVDLSRQAFWLTAFSKLPYHALHSPP